MIKLFMQKKYFHNNLVNKKKDVNKVFQTRSLHPKRVVDINKLLNRVKINKKNETKRKVIFFTFTILALSLMTIFITIIR